MACNTDIITILLNLLSRGNLNIKLNRFVFINLKTRVLKIKKQEDLLRDYIPP